MSSSKKIQPADPKAQPVEQENDDKTVARKANQIHYGGRKSGRKTSHGHIGG